METITITHEFVNFNATHLAGFTQEQFLKEFEDSKVYKNFSTEDRKKLLQEAHAKCVKAIKGDEKPAKSVVK